IAVYPATREEKLSFRQLRATDLSPIRYKKVADVDQKEVTADQIVKGFEYERGRFIVLKEEDFAKVRIESTHSIDITDFVDLTQVDPKFFYKPYFLEPQKDRDEYRNAMMEISEQKAQHKEIAKKPEPVMRTTNVVDLVKVLQESLNRNQSLKPKKNGSRPAARRSTSTLVKQKRRVAA